MQFTLIHRILLNMQVNLVTHAIKVPNKCFLQSDSFKIRDVQLKYTKYLKWLNFPYTIKWIKSEH